MYIYGHKRIACRWVAKLFQVGGVTGQRRLGTAALVCTIPYSLIDTIKIKYYNEDILVPPPPPRNSDFRGNVKILGCRKKSPPLVIRTCPEHIYHFILGWGI